MRRTCCAVAGGARRGAGAAAFFGVNHRLNVAMTEIVVAVVVEEEEEEEDEDEEEVESDFNRRTRRLLFLLRSTICAFVFGLFMGLVVSSLNERPNSAGTHPSDSDRVCLFLFGFLDVIDLFALLSVISSRCFFRARRTAGDARRCAMAATVEMSLNAKNKRISSSIRKNGGCTEWCGQFAPSTVRAAILLVRHEVHLAGTNDECWEENDVSCVD